MKLRKLVMKYVSKYKKPKLFLHSAKLQQKIEKALKNQKIHAIG